MPSYSMKYKAEPDVSRTERSWQVRKKNNGKTKTALTEVKTKACIETSHTIGSDDIPHGFKIARRFAKMNSFSGSYCVFQLASDLCLRCLPTRLGKRLQFTYLDEFES